MIKLSAIDHVDLRVKDIDGMRRLSMIDLVEVDGPLGKPGGVAPGDEGRNMDHLCPGVDAFDEDAIVAHLKKHKVAVGDIKNRYGAEGNGVSIYLTEPGRQRGGAQRSVGRKGSNFVVDMTDMRLSVRPEHLRNQGVVGLPEALLLQ